MLRTDVATVLQGREIRRRERLGGMASGDLELLRTRDPGVVLHAERMLNQEFVRRTASLLPGHATLADAYFAAQHCGLPTRLLDWTTQALTALFFAVADNSHDDADGAVLVFNPLHRLYVTLGDSAG